jgi:hypothetical protein
MNAAQTKETKMKKENKEEALAIESCIKIESSKLPRELKAQGYTVICIPGDDERDEPACWFAVRIRRASSN